MDWTFRLRDRRLRRWVAYIAAVFAYLSAPHSASLPRYLRSRLANPRYTLSHAAGAHISLRMAHSPAATLRASVQDFNHPPTPSIPPDIKISGLSFQMGAFNAVYFVRLFFYWGFSIRSSLLSGAILYNGSFLIRCSVSSRTCILLVLFYLILFLLGNTSYFLPTSSE